MTYCLPLRRGIISPNATKTKGFLTVIHRAMNVCHQRCRKIWFLCFNPCTLSVYNLAMFEQTGKCCFFCVLGEAVNTDHTRMNPSWSVREEKTYMFLSVRSSKLYPRMRWWVSDARTVRPSLRHHRHCTRTPSHESSKFPSKSFGDRRTQNAFSNNINIRDVFSFFVC